MEEVLERIGKQEIDIASVGTTVVQTSQLLTDLEMLDTHAQVTNKSHTTSARSQSEVSRAECCVAVREQFN